jgi:hypothetical protein
MGKQKVNYKILKEFTGKLTQKEALIELGHRLAMCYSAAYDPDDLCQVDIGDRWQVLLDKHSNFTVFYYDEPMTSMTANSAYEKVTNPAILMYQSGLAGKLSPNLMEGRFRMLFWIDPNDTGELMRTEGRGIMKWILEDNGRTWTATLNRPIGVVFKVRPDRGRGSDSEVWVGDTTRLGGPDVTLVTLAHTSHHPDSMEARAKAVTLFREWAMDVVINAATDGRGNMILDIGEDLYE